jgi:predicted TPR repeat methyltransferase
MADKHTTLIASEVEAYSNRFGKNLDSRGSYEDPALNEVIAHASFQNAERIFEFGCETGKFAERF